MTHTLVIGPGRAGRALALAHRRAGDAVTLVGRRDGAWREWAAAREIEAVFELEAAFAARRILIAVPDRELPAVAAACAHVLPGSDRFFAHLSGIHGPEALAAASDARRAALHPILQFVEPESDLARLRASLVSVAVAEESRAEALATVAVWGARAHELPPATDRRRYHLGLALAANHLTALLAFAETMLAEAFGAQAREVAAGMAEQAIAAVRARGAPGALTGAVVRGDLATVRAHFAALDAAERRAYAGQLEALIALAQGSGRLGAEPAAALRALAEAEARRP